MRDVADPKSGAAFDRVDLFDEFRTVAGDLSEVDDEYPRCYVVMRMRYGAGGVGRKTLEICGKHLSITRECVRQIEARAERVLWTNLHPHN